MNHLIESLTPLGEKVSEKSAYLGIVLALVLFAFALFLPWATVPEGVAANDGGESSGWSELGFVSLLPFLGLILSIASVRKPIRPKTLLFCILASFALLGFDNVENRSTWQRPFRAFTDSDDYIPHANFGSALGVGFWLGFLALIAISVFGLAWSLHKHNAVAFKGAGAATAD